MKAKLLLTVMLLIILILAPITPSTHGFSLPISVLSICVPLTR